MDGVTEEAQQDPEKTSKKTDTLCTYDQIRQT